MRRCETSNALTNIRTNTLNEDKKTPKCIYINVNVLKFEKSNSIHSITMVISTN